MALIQQINCQLQYDNQLCLYNKEVLEQDIKYICEASYRICVLNLSSNNITSIKMIHFSNTNWARLSWLSMSDNFIGGKGCKYLTKTSMERLNVLVLHHNSFGNEGLLHLSKGQWKNLSGIFVDHIKMNQIGVSYLIRGYWHKLQDISLGERSKNEVEDNYNLQLIQLSDLLLSQFSEMKKILLNYQNRQSNIKCNIIYI